MAVALLTIGLFGVMKTERDASLGPVTPVAPLLPLFPSPDDVALSFPVAGMVKGLSPEHVGMPYRVAAFRDKVFVVDAFALSGIIKVYDNTGENRGSFAVLGSEDLSFIVDIHVNKQGQVVVLDSTPAIHLFSAEGVHLRRIDVVSGGSDPELAWAKAVLEIAGEYYVLSLGSLLHIGEDGKFLEVYPRRTDSYDFATLPSEYYLGPSGLAANYDGIWVSDSLNGRIVLLSLRGNFLDEIVLPISSAGLLPYPTSIEIDSAGVIYVVDALHWTLIALDRTGNVLWEEKLTQMTPEGYPEEVFDLALVRTGLLAISDSLSRRVELWQVSEEGVLSKEIMTSSEYTYLFPSAVAVKDEDIYTLASANDESGNFSPAIYKSHLSSGTSLLASSWDGEPFKNPGALNINGDRLYLLDMDRVLVFDLEGQQLGVLGEDVTDWGGFATVNLFGEIIGPGGIAISSRGEVYVSDTFAHRIIVFDQEGHYVAKLAFSADVFPTAIQFAPDNTLLVLNGYEGNVLRVSTNGDILSTMGSAGNEPGQLGVVFDVGRFDGARGLVVDDDGSIYVVDTYNSRILKFSAAGNYLGYGGHFGSKAGEVYLPSGAFIDKVRGLLYLADTYNHRIQVMVLPR
jgi:DNA-binding beta-propeller fold protein YncE